MRNVTAGGQDLEQHVNSEIKRMATVQPSASIANVGNGLEMLGAKIGAIGMKLEERKRAMAADRWETDLQIGTKNVLSNPDNINAMKAGDYNKVRDELQKLYDRMNAEMETSYGIKDERTKFALEKARDVLYANTFASLNVNEVGYLDELQKGEFTKMMNDKENLEIHYMNSKDQTTANAVYQSYIRSLDAGLQDKLITPEEHQSRLRRIKRIRVTGRAERMVEDAYNAGNTEELRRLSVELDHSDYIHKLDGNGDERLGNLADAKLRALLSAEKEKVLTGNIRDDFRKATDLAQTSGDEDYTKLADKAEKAYDKFIGGDAWLMSLDRSGVSIENSGTMTNYFNDGIYASLEQLYGKEYADLNLTGKKTDELINIAKSTYVKTKNGSRKTLWDIMDFSSDPNINLGDKALSAPNPVKYLKEQIDTRMFDAPYEVRNKLLRDVSRRLGYDEFSTVNLDNTTPQNKTGAKLESMLEYMKPNSANIFGESDYEFQKKERMKEKGWKETSWQKFGIITNMNKKYRDQAEYFMSLEGDDYMKLAYQSLVNRCNALMVKTDNEDEVQEAFMNGMDIIMGENVISEINGEKFIMNRSFEGYTNTFKQAGIDILKDTEVFQSVDGAYLPISNIHKTTNMNGNVYIKPIGNDDFVVCHKAFGVLYNADEKPFVINIAKVRADKLEREMYSKSMPKGNYISTPLSLYNL